MGKLYVYSTLTADQRYTNYQKGGADMPRATGEVFVKGGAGVANDRLMTPRGVVTEITAEDLVILEANTDFQLHRENGFVEVSEHYMNPNDAAADMENRDAGAPLVPADLPEDQQPKAPSGPTVASNEPPVVVAKSAAAAAASGSAATTPKKR